MTRLRFVGRERAMKLARLLYDEKQMTLLEIEAELAARGHCNERGKLFATKAIRTILGERRIKARRERKLTDAEVKAVVDGARAGYSHSRLAKMHGVPYRAVGLAVRRAEGKGPEKL